MNGIHRLLGIVVALVFATFALPGHAAPQSQNKTYSLDVTVLTQGNSLASSKLLAVIKNTSPSSSSSTINSVDIFVDLGWQIDKTMAPIVVESVDRSTTYTADLSQDGHIKVSNLYPLKPFGTSNNQLEITFWITSASSGDGSWEGNIWSGSQLGSGNFFTRNAGSNIATVASASADCNDIQPPTVGDPGQVIAFRDNWNKDGTSTGTTCGAVNYYASNTLNNYVGLPDSIVHFRWDQSDPTKNETFSSAAFMYWVFYPGTTAPNTQVGWLYQDGTPAVGAGANPNAVSTNPVVFIPTPPCDVTGTAGAPRLPTPYGSLNSPLNSSSNIVKIDTSTGVLSPPAQIPQPNGFPIYIEHERMQVRAYLSNGWQVDRGQMGTAKVSHPKNALIMSTPLPAIPVGVTTYLADGITVVQPSHYQPGAQAQMCLATTGVISGVPYNQFIDIGDGWGTVR